MKQTTKQNRISLSGLWLTVALLVILILASLTLLGALAVGYAKGEPNVIELVADSRAMEQEYDDDFPAGALPEMEAEDHQVQWETETSVDLFKTAYTGPDGSVTVESAAGDKLIAPGTSNTYSFTLRNTGNIDLDYSMVLDGVFRLADKDIPMFVRLSRDGEWIMGGEESWLHVNEMQQMEEADTLPRGESTVYLFEWMWPYELDEETDMLVGDILDTLIASDSHDTELGSVQLEVDTRFELNIGVTSEISAGAVAEFASGKPVLPRYILVTAMACLIAGSGIWLLLLLFLRRNIWFTALVTPPVPGTVTLDRDETQLAEGRFTFEKTRLGKRKLTLAGVGTVIRFRYRGKVQGLSVLPGPKETVVSMGRGVRAVELYFTGSAVNPVQWAAIDRKRNVYTPIGVTPPVNNQNCTPGGLMVDEDGHYGVTVRERPHVHA